MRRFGDGARFLALLAEGRSHQPELGARSNVIVGFPGETRGDVSQLAAFLEAARLDAVGVFGYSDEEGTEAAGLAGKVGAATIGRRVSRIVDLAEQLTAERARERIGSVVEVLVEELDTAAGVAEGRAAHQAPEVDGSCTVHLPAGGQTPAVGDLVRAEVVASNGVDLVTQLTEIAEGAGLAAATGAAR
jgi:tRNA A37 methylthiotransferase MiaB